MFAVAHRSSPYQLNSALPGTVLKRFMVSADPRSEPLNVGINRVFQERVAGATAASVSLWSGFQVSLELIRWKLAIWFQRPALRCLSVYLVGRRSGRGRWGAGGTQNANANNLDMGMEELKFTAVAPTWRKWLLTSANRHVFSLWLIENDSSAGS